MNTYGESKAKRKQAAYQMESELRLADKTYANKSSTFARKQHRWCQNVSTWPASMLEITLKASLSLTRPITHWTANSSSIILYIFPLYPQPLFLPSAQLTCADPSMTSLLMLPSKVQMFPGSTCFQSLKSMEQLLESLLGTKKLFAKWWKKASTSFNNILTANTVTHFAEHFL